MSEEEDQQVAAFVGSELEEEEQFDDEERGDAGEVGRTEVELSSSNEEEKKPKKKKKFEIKASPKCTFCSKSVYNTESCVDSKDRVHHKNCLRCNICKTSLVGKQPIEDVDQLKLTASQFRVRIDEFDIKKYYCNKHGNLNRGTITQGTIGRDQRAKRNSEKQRLEDNSELNSKNQEIKKEMEVMVGDVVPLCSKCGGNLDGCKNVIVSGMERFHDICPENVEITRTPRYFVKTCENRPVVALAVEEGGTTYSFMYEICTNSKKEALLLKKGAPVALTFAPDSKAKSGTVRKLPDSHKTAVPQFSLTMRNVKGLTNQDPTGQVYEPRINVAMEGEVELEGKPHYLTLQHDGLFRIHKLSAKSGSKALSQELVLDQASTVVSTGAGFQLNDELSFETHSRFHAQAWLRAIEGVITNGIDYGDFGVVTVRLFAITNKVLQQWVFTFAHCQSPSPKIGIMENAVLMLSEYPEKTLEEQKSKDPLAQLKTQLQGKEQQDAQPADDTAGPRVEQKVKKKKKKKGCVVM